MTSILLITKEKVSRGEKERKIKFWKTLFSSNHTYIYKLVNIERLHSFYDLSRTEDCTLINNDNTLKQIEDEETDRSQKTKQDEHRQKKRNHTLG